MDDSKLIMNRWNVEFPSSVLHRIITKLLVWVFMNIFYWQKIWAQNHCRFLNCGMACQFNSGEVVAMDELHPYIDDALDLIEFANGAYNY